VNASRFLAFLLLATFTTRAAADLVPPEGSKYLPVTTIVEVEKEYADYIFLSISWKWSYVPVQPPAGTKIAGKRSGPGRSGPDVRRFKSEPTIELVTIVPGKPFQFDGTTHNGRALFAVPKSALDECRDWKSLARSLRKLAKDAENDAIPGAKLHPYRSYSELPLHDSRSVVVLRYLFQHAPGGGVEFMTDRDPSLYVVDPRGDEGPRTRRSPMAVAGAAATLGVILLGLWVMSRSRRLGQTTEVHTKGS
jgi:hypothetical protein